MDVGVSGTRELEMNDVVNGGDVETSCSDVSSDENSGFG